MTQYENVILIPYRNRKEHLTYFLEHSWVLIKEHLPNSKLVIIEQDEGKLFNRGKVLNVGFKEYLDKTNNFITHDVDINPNNKGIELYKIIPTDNTIIGIYSSPCKTLGGIIKINANDIIKINGFPNNFWGWGVEDRVLYNRAIHYKYNISFNSIARTTHAQSLFTVFDNVNDRITHNNIHNNTNLEYNIFDKLDSNTQLKHIMSSGLNNLDYTILERTELEPNVELIKVKL